jgi:hypothetical protein
VTTARYTGVRAFTTENKIQNCSNNADHCTKSMRITVAHTIATVNHTADYCLLPCSIFESLILPQLQCPCVLVINDFASSESVDSKYGCDGVRQAVVDGSGVKVVTSDRAR